jgi:CRISPR-associated endonuclease/helicase Cas3
MTLDVVQLLSDNLKPADGTAGRDPDLILKGVPTDSVLGLLCAVGTLRVLDAAWPCQGVRMAWRRIEGVWKPCLWASAGTLRGSEAEKRTTAVAQLSEQLSRPDSPWFTVAGDPLMTLAEFVAAVQRLPSLETKDRQGLIDWLPALGCEHPEQDKKKGVCVSDTDLSTMRDASRQQLLKEMRNLAACCTPPDLHAALFAGWTYSDPKPYLRLDPKDDRTAAAYQAYDPQDRDGKHEMSPITTVRGANRLAAEAFPVFPTAPLRARLATTAFVSRRSETTFRFPLWTDPITCTSLRWLLRHPELTVDEPNRALLASMGVHVVLQATRNQTDKGSRSFLPVVPRS